MCDSMIVPAIEMEFPSTALTPIDNSEQLDSETQPNKRKRKKSIVWEHFTVENVGDGCTRARCNQCKKSFAYITGSKLAGTSHLKRHIALGICPVYRQDNQLTPYTPGSNADGSGVTTDPPKRRQRGPPKFATTPFDQEHCNHDIAKMIIQHDYPLHIVEHPGFIDFVHTLQPQFNMVSFNTVQGDCVGIYLTEKQSLMDLIGGIPGRVCLTLDMWTSNQALGYVVVTGHFIDGDWNLHRRVLNVVMAPFPDSDEASVQAVVSCLSDWHLEGKLFSLTLDHFFSSEMAVGNLKGLLSVRNPHMLNGQLLQTTCFARLLSRLAQDALGSMDETVKKIRESVKYVKTSDAREDKFFELKQQLQVPSSKVPFIDDRTKWDTTYHMLAAASELKEVFACLDTSDPDYKMTPSMEEWNQIETLCSYLKLFLDAANVLTSPSYPTTNVFFHEVWKIHWELMHAVISQDPFLSNLAKPLQERSDVYWRDCCLALAVAVVMDPRYKMKLVEFSFSKSFGEDAEAWIRMVDDGVHELYYEYTALPLPMPDTCVEGNDGEVKTEMPQETHLTSTSPGLSDFELYIHQISGSQQMKSEIDLYLEEPLLPRIGEFDILSWWKVHRAKYPVLSRMAADVLSIPVSTVAPDSVFDTESKKIDNYRSSIPHVTLEALVCTKDWLQYRSSEPVTSNVKMEY